MSILMKKGSVVVKSFMFREPNVNFKNLLTGWKVKDEEISFNRASDLVKTSARGRGFKKEISKNRIVYQQPLPERDDAFTLRVSQKDTVEADLIYQALRQNFVFSDLSKEALAPLVAAFELCVFQEGDCIIRQGDPGDYFYIIKSGMVIFQVNGKGVGKAMDGASFGELSLLYTCPRAATVIAAEKSLIFRVDQSTFRYILKSQTQQHENEKASLLMNVDFLRGFNNVDVKKMTRVMTPRVFQKDELIIRKGDPGDAFYIVAEGNVLVKDISVGSTIYENQVLGPGEYFGERALAVGEPRAANVVGLSKGVAFSIDRETFEKVLGKMSNLIMKAQDARRLAGVKVLKEIDLDHQQFASLAANMVDREFRKDYEIICKGLETKSALYFVREGKVEVDMDGKINTIGAGGYFGESLFISQPTTISPYTVRVVENCVCGVLAIMDCREAFDVHRLDSHAQSREADLPIVPGNLTTDATLEDLERHAILGEGTFGQVHLVSETLQDGTRSPYALKILCKTNLATEGQVNAVIREKNVMSELRHPFLVNLVKTYQDENFIYMLLPLLQGGELFSVLHYRDDYGLPESQARFYSLCIADAISYMHRQKYVYRDLKPENVIIDNQGYPVIIDFGFTKRVIDQTFTLCGTPQYLPPEVIMSRGHNCSADHWSFGILVHELLSGSSPFFDEGMDQMSLFEAIVQDDFDDPIGVSEKVVALIRLLLIKVPEHRLGSLAQGERDILEHPWFEGLELHSLRQRRSSDVPWLPTVKDPLDTSNFDDWSHLEDKTKVPPTKKVPPDLQAMFEEF